MSKGCAYQSETTGTAALRAPSSGLPTIFDLGRFYSTTVIEFGRRDETSDSAPRSVVG